MMVSDGTKIYLVVGTILKNLTWNGSILQGTKAYSYPTSGSGTELALNSTKIFYVGTDNKIHYNNRLTTSTYGTLGSTIVDNKTDLIANSDHVYFYDSNGYPSNYYTTNGTNWYSGKLITSSSVKVISGSQMAKLNSSILFADRDGYLHEFYYNTPTPQWVDGDKPIGTESSECSGTPGIVVMGSKVCFTGLGYNDSEDVIRYITDTEISSNKWTDRESFSHNGNYSEEFTSELGQFTGVNNYTRKRGGTSADPHEAQVYLNTQVSLSGGELVLKSCEIFEQTAVKLGRFV